MKYSLLFFLMVFMWLQTLANADSTRVNTVTDSVKYYDGEHLAADSAEIAKRIVEEYERLEAFNDANEEEGRPDENIYVINPGSFDLEKDMWVRVLSASKPILEIPEIKKINDRLIEFNDSRQDKLRIYAVLYFGFKAYLKSNAAPPAKEYKFENDYKESLKKYFSDADLERLLKFTYTTMPTAVANVDAAMEAKGYDRIIYSYAGYRFYTPDGTAHYYTWETLKIGASPDTVVDKNGKKSSVPSKLQKKRKEIAAQVRQQITSYKDQTDYTRQAIENIIAAIRTKYDRKEDISDKGVTDCGKSQEKLWPVSDAEYMAAVESTAKVFELPGEKLGENYIGSDYIKTDQPERFYKSNFLLHDRAFVNEKLPELLNLLPSQSDHRMWVLFSEVKFVIPRDKRAKFAQDVYERVGSKISKLILVVVPYYACGTQEVLGSIEVSDLQLMPAVYSADAEMNLKMNAPLVREGEGFRSGFETAFENVPKDHTVYASYTFWNGQNIFRAETKKRAIGFSNFVDVYVFVDDRVNQIKKHLTCKDEYDKESGKALATKFPDTKELTAIYQTYSKCLNKSDGAISQVLLQQPNPTFKMLPVGVCQLKQSKLEGEDGMLLALSFAKQTVRKLGIRFWTEAGGGTFGKESFEEDDFYEKKNPFKEKSIIFKIIDVTSLLISFIGLDFIFDTAGLGLACVLGDDAGMLEYSVALILPAFLMKGFKELKMINGSSRDVFRLSIDEGGFVTRSGDNLFVLKLGEGGSLMSGPKDGADLFRAMGVVDNEVLAAIKADASLREALEASMVVKNGNKIKPKPPVPGYDYDHLKLRMNDRNVVSRYRAARQADNNLDFISFLKKIDNAPTILKLGPFAKEVNGLETEKGWFTLLVDRVETNGKVIVQEGNILKELDAAAIAERMKKSGYPEGEPIRIVSLNSSKSKDIEKLTDELAEKFNTKAKTHADDISIGETGILKTIGREDNYVHWLELDYGKLPGPEGIVRKKEFELEKMDRVFTLIPHKIKPDGSVLCQVDGKLVTYTPEEIAGLLEKNGLRSDEVIRIGLPKNEFLSSNYDNLPELANKLNRKVENQIGYIRNRDFFIEPHNLSYDHPDLKKLRESGRLPNYIDESLVVIGEKKPLVLFTEANFKIAEKDRNLYVIVEGFTENGKIKIHQPLTGKAIELSHSEFLKEIERVYGKQAVANNPMRIVPTAGTVNEVQARKFIEELAQKLQAKVEIAKSAVNATDGAVLPVKNLDWFFRNPMDEGMFFLQKNIPTAQLNKILDKGDEFAEELGKALSQNNGRYLPKFKSDPTWLEDIYADYNKYNKISLPTFVNIKSISKRLDNMDLPNALVKDLYDNPLFAKKLDEQLKWLDPSDIKKLKTDADLFTEALRIVESEAYLGGKGLPYFMASKNLEKKLPDLFQSIKDKFGDDVRFFSDLSKEIDNMSKELLNKFKLYTLNDEFLEEFKLLHKSMLGNPNAVADLPLHTMRYQEQNQFILAGANDRLRGTADALLPQEGYMDVFLRADGHGNFIGDVERIYTPAQVAELIRKNPHWDERPIRFIVDGKDPKSTAQLLVDELGAHAKINRQTNIGEIKGKVKEWDELLAPGGGKVVFQSDPVLEKLAKEIKYDARYFYVFIHGDKDGFQLALADGTGVFISEVHFANWLAGKPDFVAAINSGKNVKLISCCAAASDAAKKSSAILYELKMKGLIKRSPMVEAPDVRYGINSEIDEFGRHVEGSPDPGGKWHAYQDGKHLGPIKNNADIPQFGTGLSHAAGNESEVSTLSSISRAEWRSTGDVWVYAQGVSQHVGSGFLDRNGIIGMSIDVKIGANNDAVAKGGEVFKKIFDEIEKKNGSDKIKCIRGFWLDDPKLRDNLESFNNGILENISKGMDKKVAAIKAAKENTFTGVMAGKMGFTEVERIGGLTKPDGTYREATVYFVRPK